MIRAALQICLTVMALLLSASVSSAADCTSDPNECTLKKLCEVATTVDGGNTIWSTATGFAKHVTVAQSLGIECGITPIVDLCETDPSECKLSQICEKATTDSAGQISWDDSAAEHVALAKEYGLSCDVVVEAAAIVKTEICSLTNKSACNDEQKLCRMATKLGVWDTRSGFIQYVKEAKKRGLSCGVETAAEQVKSKSVCNLTNQKACDDPKLLCRFATSGRQWETISGRQWETISHFIQYVIEAKKRGLSCGVKTKAVPSSAKLKNAFIKRIKLERQQMQYALKKLGYYKGGVDGVWGPKTQAALSGFVSKENVKLSSILFVLSELVNVPTSFSAPKKKATTSNNSSGWRSFSANPRHSLEQAKAICEPQARMAGEQAGGSYRGTDLGSTVRCRETVLGYNCNQSRISGGFWSGVADALGERGAERKAAMAVLNSCMAKYGWTK